MWIWMLSLLGCGIKRLLPEGPVIDPWERQRVFEVVPSGTDYTGPPIVEAPVLPVMAFGLAYDLDLVIVSRHPEWNMHEYARLRTRDGPLWLAKDSREGTLSQSIVADVPDLESWMPEAPVQRKSWPVEVTDRSTADRVEVEISYENIDGEPVRVHFEGKPPTTPMAKRNGSTLGHSRDEILLVLDLSHRTFARKSHVEIAGTVYKPERILGLLPFHTAMVQSQAGLVIGQYTQAGTRTVHRTFSGGEAMMTWQVELGEDTVDLVQEHSLRTLRYHFLRDGDSLELQSIASTQWGRGSPTLYVQFSPALPDLRRPFRGDRESRMLVDVNGQESHAIGRVNTRWEADTVVVDFAPERPWWVAERPLRSTIRFDEDQAEVEVVRR